MKEKPSKRQKLSGDKYKEKNYPNRARKEKDTEEERNDKEKRQEQ